MSGPATWILGYFIAGFLLSPVPSRVFCYYQDFPPRFHPWQVRPLPPPPRQPAEIMTDSINRLGTRVLMQYVERGNVAFSPAGLGFILSALYEGSGGRSRQQITDSVGFPNDRNIVRMGMRDLHMRLRTYLNPDGFLGGLNLNRENTSLRSNYETILRFYGFDLSVDLSNIAANSSNNFGLRGSMTTGAPNMGTNGGTTMTPGMMDMTTIPPNTAAAMTTIDTTVVILPNTTPSPTALTQSTQPPTTQQPTPANIQNMPTTMVPTTQTTTTGRPTTTTTMPTTTNMPTTTAAIAVTTMPTTTRRRPTTTLPPPTMMSSMSMMSSQIISSTLPRTTATTTTEAPTTTTTDMPTTTEFMFLEDIATVAAPTIATIPALVRRKRTNLRKRRSNLDGYFSSYPDDGIWMQDLGIWAEQPPMPTNARTATDMQFFVNGCELTTVPAASYSAILPFGYFPSLKAAAVEFPLDNPRYNVILFLPQEKVDTGRLARELGAQNLRLLRRHLQPTWTRATIPSFMLRGFVTLTSYLQRLGIKDVFEPRLADLSPMTPDLGVYARDIQQSIAVNIRNYMRPDDPNAPTNPQPTEMPLTLPPRRDPRFQRPVDGQFGTVSFRADHPFLFFIVDDETSVALIAGRIDDPLNSRIL